MGNGLAQLRTGDAQIASVLNYVGVRLVTAGGGATGCELHLHPEPAGVA